MNWLWLDSACNVGLIVDSLNYQGCYCLIELIPFFLNTWFLSWLQSTCVREAAHHYTGPFEATTHVVVGGGGSSLAKFTPLRTRWSYYQDYDFGFVKLTAFNQSTLLLEYKKSRDGLVYDYFTITRDYRDILDCAVDSCSKTSMSSWAGPLIALVYWRLLTISVYEVKQMNDYRGASCVLMSYIDYQAKLGWSKNTSLFKWFNLYMKLETVINEIVSMEISALWFLCHCYAESSHFQTLCTLSRNSLNSMTSKVMSQFGLESAVHDNGFTVSLNTMDKLIGFTSQFPYELKF